MGPPRGATTARQRWAIPCTDGSGLCPPCKRNAVASLRVHSRAPQSAISFFSARTTRRFNPNAAARLVSGWAVGQQ